MWIFKESSKPSPSDVISYWNKPRLSKVSSTSFARTSDFGEVSCPTDIDVAQFFCCGFFTSSTCEFFSEVRINIPY